MDDVRHCRHCGTQMTSSGLYCVSCGRKDDDAPRSASSLWPNIATAALVVLGFVVTGVITGTEATKSNTELVQSELLLLQRRATLAGAEPSEARVQLVDCLYPCRSEYKRFRETLPDWEQELQSVVSDLNFGKNFFWQDTDAKSREIRNAYLGSYLRLLDAAERWKSGIDESGTVVDPRELEKGDERFTKAQGSLSDLVNATKKALRD